MAVKTQKNFIGKLGSKSKMMNTPTKGSGKLTKNGQVYKNNLLDADFTRQDMGTVRKLKGN